MRERYLGFTTLAGDERARTREKRAANLAPTRAIEMIRENYFDAYSLSMRKAVN